jgi:hypothetical protein
MQKLAAVFLGTAIVNGLAAAHFWQQLQSEVSSNVPMPHLVAQPALDRPHQLQAITEGNRRALAAARPFLSEDQLSVLAQWLESSAGNARRALENQRRQPDASGPGRMQSGGG